MLGTTLRRCFTAIIFGIAAAAVRAAGIERFEEAPLLGERATAVTPRGLSKTPTLVVLKLAGVLSVRPVEVVEREHTNGGPLIGAPAVWEGLAGFRGQGVKIAVLDSGIDFTHANFEPNPRDGIGRFGIGRRTHVGRVSNTSCAEAI